MSNIVIDQQTFNAVFEQLERTAKAYVEQQMWNKVLLNRMTEMEDHMRWLQHVQEHQLNLWREEALEFRRAHAVIGSEFLHRAMDSRMAGLDLLAETDDPFPVVGATQERHSPGAGATTTSVREQPG